jgi:hypothetical protein
MYLPHQKMTLPPLRWQGHLSVWQGHINNGKYILKDGKVILKRGKDMNNV